MQFFEKNYKKLRGLHNQVTAATEKIDTISYISISISYICIFIVYVCIVYFSLIIVYVSLHTIYDIFVYCIHYSGRNWGRGARPPIFGG